MNGNGEATTNAIRRSLARRICSDRTARRLLLAGAILLALSPLFVACTNSNLQNALPSTGTTGVANLITSYQAFTINSVSVSGTAAGNDSNGSMYPVTIQFTLPSEGSSNLEQVCMTTGTFPCVCEFNWVESNTTTSPPTSVTRAVYTPVTAVQTAAIQCNTPDVWDSQVPNSTTINISVMPGAGSAANFSTNVYPYVKGENPATGNFSDNQGDQFANILRYSCYEQVQRGLSIESKMAVGCTTVNSTQQEFSYPVANQYCFASDLGSAGSSNSSSGSASSSSCNSTYCGTSMSVGYSAQANYFNLYIQSTETGDINPGNTNFVCPTVTQGLNSGSTGGTQGKYWPLDTSFALAMGSSSTFTVGVAANTVTANASDPTATSSACVAAGTASPTPTANPSPSAGSAGLISGCLGWAAAPNPDGTCTAITNSDGTTIPLYRLRRYVALYPTFYDTSGQSLNQPQQVDTVYVIDRPVSGPGGATYTMRGPKPCPFAYFDKPGVVDGTPGYYGTNNSGWNGKNVDGISFPNSDTQSSCTALLTLPSGDGSKVTMGTVSQTTPTYVRPQNGFAPHYEEDTSFLACAPLSNPLQDPPLHFYENGGNVGFCAEVYPTQNNNVGKLDPNNTGTISNFTSHVVKNSTSTACSYDTTLSYPSGYPGGGVARHTGTCDNGQPCTSTCDRTVVNPVNGIAWPAFPLLGPASDVENAMASDLSDFTCTITWDNSGASNNGSTKVGVLTPSGGCCGTSVSVTTGEAGVNTAHLEPAPAGQSYTPSCSVPTY